MVDTVRLRLDGLLAGTRPDGHIVRVETANGTTIRTLSTDAYGEVRIPWQGVVGMTATEVRVEVDVDARTAARVVIVRAAPPTTAFGLLMVDRTAGDGQAWFQERQLRNPIRVRITDVPDESKCKIAAVLFQAKVGGATTPDTAYGLWDVAAKQCFATTRWRLGKDVGEQHLRAALAGESAKQIVFTAKSRALPRLVGGLAMVFTSAYDTLTSKTRTVRVERPTPGGNIAYDSAITTVGVGHASSGATYSPILAIDHPLWPNWDHVRWVGGVSATRPKDDYFFGFSLLQPIFGVNQEGIGIDLQFIAQVSRRRVLADPPGCEQIQACATKSRTGVVGAGVSLTIDTGGLLTNLLTALSR